MVAVTDPSPNPVVLICASSPTAASKISQILDQSGMKSVVASDTELTAKLTSDSSARAVILSEQESMLQSEPVLERIKSASPVTPVVIVSDKVTGERMIQLQNHHRVLVVEPSQLTSHLLKAIDKVSRTPIFGSQHKRAALRLPVTIDTFVTVLGHKIKRPAQIRNISFTGALLEKCEKTPAGKHLEVPPLGTLISLTLAQQETIGQVVWSKGVQFGVKFFDLTEEQEAEVKSLIVNEVARQRIGWYRG